MTKIARRLALFVLTAATFWGLHRIDSLVAMLGPQARSITELAGLNPATAPRRVHEAWQAWHNSQVDIEAALHHYVALDCLLVVAYMSLLYDLAGFRRAHPAFHACALWILAAETTEAVVQLSLADPAHAPAPPAAVALCIANWCKWLGLAAAAVVLVRARPISGSIAPQR